jgi:membrane protease YdiL (CAAX protease family)
LTPIRASRLEPKARAAVAYGAAAAVLLLTRFAPSFAFLGPRGALFGWLAYATAVTAGVPIAMMALGFGPPLARCGLSWGRARRDAHWIALGLAAVVVLAAVLARVPSVQAYYPRHGLVKTEPLLWLPSTLAFAAYGFAWEALFRGFLLLGIAPRFGLAAVFMQTVPFALAHLDKPPIEAWLAIPAGVFFGLVALRTRSVLPGFLLHFTLSTSLNLFCAYAH